jgi:eukaryotic-like serine/threonine-protein kinase
MGVMSHLQDVAAPALWPANWLSLGQIGRGHFADVYRACRPEDAGGGTAALKLFRTDRFHGPELRHVLDTMASELACLREMTGPRIPRLIEEHPESDPHYIAVELIEGVSFADWIDSQGGSPLDWPAVHDFGLGLLDAVAGIHQAGFLHRDLKPANIQLRGGMLADPLVLDFNRSVRLGAPMTALSMPA